MKKIKDSHIKELNFIMGREGSYIKLLKRKSSLLVKELKADHFHEYAKNLIGNILHTFNNRKRK